MAAYKVVERIAIKWYLRRVVDTDRFLVRTKAKQPK
jgi:hypothetical protein